MKQIDPIICSVCESKFIEAKSHIYYIKVKGKKIKQCSYNCNQKALANKEAKVNETI